jgi:hypothetical protein
MTLGSPWIDCRFPIGLPGRRIRCATEEIPQLSPKGGIGVDGPDAKTSVLTFVFYGGVVTMTECTPIA